MNARRSGLSAWLPAPQRCRVHSLWQVKNERPSLSSEEARTVTLELLHDALIRDEMVVGEFRGAGKETFSFIAWQCSPTNALERIELEWLALGREPSLGEIAWFVSPGLLPLSMRKPLVGKKQQ